MRNWIIMASLAIFAISCDDVIIDDSDDYVDGMPPSEEIVIISESSGFSEEEVRDMYAECLADGGRPVLGGFGQPSCELDTSDGGEYCSENSDCEGFCLAESNTCSAIRPASGCFEVMPSPDEPATICID